MCVPSGKKDEEKDRTAGMRVRVRSACRMHAGRMQNFYGERRDDVKIR